MDQAEGREGKKKGGKEGKKKGGREREESY